MALEETQDSAEIIERIAALDINKAEVVCCVRVPGEHSARHALTWRIWHAVQDRTQDNSAYIPDLATLGRVRTVCSRLVSERGRLPA